MRLTTLGLAATALTYYAVAAHISNAHHRNPSRHSRHFGAKFKPETRELTADEVVKENIQPPPGVRVFTTSVAPSYSNSSAVDEIDEDENAIGIERRAPIGKRAYSGMRATYYGIGLGACGQTDSEPAYVVALNSAQYGSGYPGPECFKSITITGGSKNGQAVATIKDECPTCPYGGLDMSEALFQNFATLDEGVATITWWYNDGTAATTSAYVAPTTSTTSTTPAYTPPSSTWTPQATTSTTPAYTPTTTSTTSTSAWTPPAVTSTTPTSTPSPTSTSRAAPSISSSTIASSSPSSSPITDSSAASSATAKTSAASSGSSGINLSSLALGKSSSTSAAKTSAGTGIATSSGTAAAATTTATKITDTNLGMLNEYLLQLGNIVVEGAQISS